MHILYVYDLAGIDCSSYVEITSAKIGDSGLGPWHSKYYRKSTIMGTTFWKKILAIVMKIQKQEHS